MISDPRESNIAMDILTDLLALVALLLSTYRAIPFWLMAGVGLGRLTFTKQFLVLTVASTVTTIMVIWLVARATHEGTRQAVDLGLLILFFGGIGFVFANSRYF